MNFLARHLISKRMISRRSVYNNMKEETYKKCTRPLHLDLFKALGNECHTREGIVDSESKVNSERKIDSNNPSL